MSEKDIPLVSQATYGKALTLRKHMNLASTSGLSIGISVKDYLDREAERIAKEPKLPVFIKTAPKP